MRPSHLRNRPQQCFVHYLSAPLPRHHVTQNVLQPLVDLLLPHNLHRPDICMRESCQRKCPGSLSTLLVRDVSAHTPE